jgi:hypothetical protein
MEVKVAKRKGVTVRWGLKEAWSKDTGRCYKNRIRGLRRPTSRHLTTTVRAQLTEPPDAEPARPGGVAGASRRLLPLCRFFAPAPYVHAVANYSILIARISLP